MGQKARRAHNAVVFVPFYLQRDSQSVVVFAGASLPAHHRALTQTQPKF
jgi:hypothetical protein